MSALEAFVNAGVGLVVSWAATFFVLGYTAAGSAAVTAMFFGLSFARAWAIREIFKRIEEAYRQPDLFIEPPAKPEQKGFDL